MMELSSTNIIKCKNSTFECSNKVEKNFSFCIKHILNDPKASSSYQKCCYITPNGNCCSNARQADPSTSTYCFEHSRMNQLNKMKATVGRKKQLDSSESIIQNLSHYVQNEKSQKPQSTTRIDDEDEEDVSVTSNNDPFFEINANDVNNKDRKILDYASDDEDGETESDSPLITLSNTWINEIDNSDDESVDSEDDNDLLKHAGIYQIEEIVKISKEKVQRLQSLYIDQFQRLQKVLKDKRKNYLQSLKKEKELYSNIYDQYRDSPKERKLYTKFKAMNHYHQRKNGVEAVLYKKFAEKRLQSESFSNISTLQQKNIPKCTFSDGVKCLERPMPQNKYCRKHILEDKKQILFKSCGIEKSGIVCQEPVINIFEDAACVLHTALYSLPRTYVKRKYESETEDEESINQKEVKIEIETPKEMKQEQIDVNEVECIVDDEIKIN